MKINHGLHRLASLTLAMLGMVWAANAATGTSSKFAIDLTGMGAWEMHQAEVSQWITYSTTWATNALDGANAVVKVYPAKREKPVALAVAGWIGSTWAVPSTRPPLTPNCELATFPKNPA